MTPHAAFIRREGDRLYCCVTCGARVAPGGRITHLNRETVRAHIDGTRPTHELEDDE